MIGEDRDATVTESDEEWAPVAPAPRFAGQLERLGRQLDAHPWLGIGIAIGAGAAIALVPSVVRRVRRGDRVKRTLGDSAFALLGAIAARVVRDYAIDGIAALAQKWTQQKR